jgi:hypothetical protein
VSSHEATKARRVLYLPLKAIYFDQIKAGNKTEEYRLQSDFWRKRLCGQSYDAIVLTRGYPKGGGVEGASRLTFSWSGFERRRICHDHFGNAWVDVFAIPLRGFVASCESKNG